MKDSPVYKVAINAPELPGVYQMFSDAEELLYIGKAKSLKKRLMSYTQKDLEQRIQLMISKVARIELILAKNELEAIMLEARLIKNMKPKYNILLKDDKFFPYIKIDTTKDFPSISKFNAKKIDKDCFGPFLSHESLATIFKEIKRIFMLRTCSDAFFKARKRPCLQYQIKQCSAPCTNKISQQDYLQSAQDAITFLSGSSKDLQCKLEEQMLAYSSVMEYEKAATIRNKIHALKQLQNKSGFETRCVENADIIGIASYDCIHSIKIFVYRGGQFFGNRSYIVEGISTSEESTLIDFAMQFYTKYDIPQEIITSAKVDDKSSLQDFLYSISNSKTKIVTPQRGDKRTLAEYATYNAEMSLKDKIKNNEEHIKIQKKLAEIFNLTNEPSRIEVYDNSHLFGQHPVGAMIVATNTGLAKSEYKTFTIKSTDQNIYGGDDYQMMREVLMRRFNMKNIPRPDLIIIDGGRGHLSVALSIIRLFDKKIKVVGMSKGPNRNAGCENFCTEEGEYFTLQNDDKVMQYLQRLRDEVHNLAINTHRKKRTKQFR